MKNIGKLVIFACVLILIATLILIGYTQKQNNLQNLGNSEFSCKENDWNCICAHIKNEAICKEYPDCIWTNFHSNEFYCMEQFCVDYNKTECEKHIRCIWVFDKNGGYEYCEGAAFFDESRHALVNNIP